MLNASQVAALCFHGAVTCEVCDPDWDRAKERKEKILAMIKGRERDEDEDPRGSWRSQCIEFLEKMVENNGKKNMEQQKWTINNNNK